MPGLPFQANAYVFVCTHWVSKSAGRTVMCLGGVVLWTMKRQIMLLTSVQARTVVVDRYCRARLKGKLMSELNGADIVVRTLADEGVEHVFGYPGGAVLYI